MYGLVPIIPYSLSNHGFESYQKTTFILLSSFVLAYGILTTSITLYIKHIRNKHRRQIAQQKARFGRTEERRQWIKSIKKHMKEVFQLNLVTVLLTLIQLAARCVDKMVFDHTSKEWKLFADVSLAVYIYSNPFTYAVIFSDIRNGYQRTIYTI